MFIVINIVTEVVLVLFCESGLILKFVCLLEKFSSADTYYLSSQIIFFFYLLNLKGKSFS